MIHTLSDRHCYIYYINIVIGGTERVNILWNRFSIDLWGHARVPRASVLMPKMEQSILGNTSIFYEYFNRQYIYIIVS